ncbi:unnamed protein product [Diamesa serratosioi]
MKMLWSFVFIFVTLCNAEVAIDRNSRITGGNEARIGQFPYMVALILGLPNYGESFCGGSIISTSFVLTAAHCLEEVIQVNVLAGIHNIFLDTPAYNQEVYPNHILKHPQYDSESLQNDIGLIFVSRPIPLSTSISAITLPTRAMATNNYIGATATVSGWGLTEKSKNHFEEIQYNGLNNLFYSLVTSDISPVLRFVALPVISNADCAKSYGSIIISSNICTSGANAKSSCQGDSGGPKTIIINNRPVQIGIVSFGAERGCCELGFTAAFTRVSMFLDWIEQNTKMIIVIRLSIVELLCVSPFNVISTDYSYKYNPLYKKECQSKFKFAMEKLFCLLLVFYFLGKITTLPVQNQKIIGGYEVHSAKVFRYQVAIYSTSSISGVNLCSGSLISSKFVLSAAHCIHTSNSSHIFYGIYNVMTPNFDNHQEVSSKNYKIHPKYQKYIADIALIELNTDVIFSDTIQPIALPSWNDQTNLFEDHKAIVAGWGVFSNEQLISEYLRFVDLNIISNKECRKMFAALVTDEIICTSGKEVKSSCSGDSGSALVSYDINNQLIQIGIVSFGTKCREGNESPSAHTRITSHLHFIEEHSDHQTTIISTTTTAATTTTSSTLIAKNKKIIIIIIIIKKSAYFFL